MLTHNSQSVTAERQCILGIAWKQFAAHGYAATSMADVARQCGLPLDRVYEQFPRKEELVGELYGLLALQLEERIVELPAGALAVRFGAVMDWKVACLEEHRGTLQALFETMIDPDRDLGVMSAHMELVRHRVRGVFTSVAWGAHDRPKDAKMPELIRHLYRMHLGLIFLWFRNPTAYRAARGMVEGLLGLSAPALNFPPLQPLMQRVDLLLSAKVEPYDEERELAEKVLLRLFQHRRLQFRDGCVDHPCQECMALHLGRVEEYIRLGEPIVMALPAFPAKSPNLDKVLGDLPDTAERLALRCLDNLCREIAEIYPPGAKLVICSDGHVFSDLVGVSDAQVTRYNQAIRDEIAAMKLDNLSLFTLSDVFADCDYARMRDELLPEYSEEPDVLRARVKAYPAHRHLFDGLHRFLFEDRLALQPDRSRNSVRQECKELTYKVMQRSNAWGRLVGMHFPQAVRLSIHPQPPHSEKIGILLSPAVDSWVTPWHGVAVLRDQDFLLMKRGQAEELGAQLVYEEGRAMHFVELSG